MRPFLFAEIEVHVHVHVHVYMYICATVIEFRFLEEKERGQLFNVTQSFYGYGILLCTVE